MVPLLAQRNLYSLGIYTPHRPIHISNVAILIKSALIFSTHYLRFISAIGITKIYVESDIKSSGSGMEGRDSYVGGFV